LGGRRDGECPIGVGRGFDVGVWIESLPDSEEAVHVAVVKPAVRRGGLATVQGALIWRQSNRA